MPLEMFRSKKKIQQTSEDTGVLVASILEVNAHHHGNGSDTASQATTMSVASNGVESHAARPGAVSNGNEQLTRGSDSTATIDGKMHATKHAVAEGSASGITAASSAGDNHGVGTNRNLSTANFRKNFDASLASHPVTSKEPIQTQAMSSEKVSESVKAAAQPPLGMKGSSR